MPVNFIGFSIMMLKGHVFCIVFEHSDQKPYEIISFLTSNSSSAYGLKHYACILLARRVSMQRRIEFLDGADVQSVCSACCPLYVLAYCHCLLLLQSLGCDSQRDGQSNRINQTIK